MKKLVLSIIIIALALPAAAQFQVGDAQVPTMGRAGALRGDDLETFKGTTTVFVVQSKDKDHIADFEKSIGDVWKVTPYKVVAASEQGAYRGRKYSLFSFGGYTVQVRSSSGMVTNHTHISYDLSMPDYDKAGEVKGRTILARFMLSPDFATVATMSGQGSTFEGRRGREERESTQSGQLFNRAIYSNWGPGQIRGYLKAINDHLAKAARRGVFDEIIEKEKIKAVAKDTLYLPAYLKDKFNAFTGAETSREDDEAEEDAFKAYPYPHRFVSENELEKLIVNANRPIYHLIYIRSSANKYVSVVDGHNGDIVYSLFHNISYNFKMKDLKKFASYMN